MVIRWRKPTVHHATFCLGNTTSPGVAPRIPDLAPGMAWKYRQPAVSVAGAQSVVKSPSGTREINADGRRQRDRDRRDKAMASGERPRLTRRPMDVWATRFHPYYTGTSWITQELLGVRRSCCGTSDR